MSDIRQTVSPCALIDRHEGVETAFVQANEAKAGSKKSGNS